MKQLSEAVAEGLIGGRLWLYSNYHCNLECAYCLTESGPLVVRREIPVERLGDLAQEAAQLGFTSLGVTGGEPFLSPGLADALPAMARQLPTLVLSNGTLFTPRLIAKLKPLAQLDFAVQLSLDSAEPNINDEMRGPRNFARVIASIPRLRAIGIKVRIATTSDDLEPESLARLCELHRSLGVPDDDHVVRPIIRRGRAALEGMGIEVGVNELPAELTVTADGAFWSPFGPTVRGGRLDTDLLVTRTTRPLAVPAAAMLRLVRPGRSQAPPNHVLVR